jgi:hypothetical protein
MRRTRYVLAVMVMTTALCADRQAIAAPAENARPVVADFARKLATRLTSSLRQTVPAIRLHTERREEALAPLHWEPQEVGVVTHPADYSPMHFRLPPPIA